MWTPFSVASYWSAVTGRHIVIAWDSLDKIITATATSWGSNSTKVVGVSAAGTTEPTVRPSLNPVVGRLLLPLHPSCTTSVVLLQQLLAATGSFGGVNMCTANTDLSPVCGTSEPGALAEQTGGARGRFLMDTASLKSSSRPCATLEAVFRQGCSHHVCVSVCFLWLKHAHTHAHTQGWLTDGVQATFDVGSESTSRSGLLSTLRSCDSTENEKVLKSSFKLLRQSVFITSFNGSTFNRNAFPVLCDVYSRIKKNKAVLIFVLLRAQKEHI